MALDRATLADRLRDARKNGGINQEQAAEYLGIPRTAMVQIEQGSRSVSSLELVRLAQLYRVDLVELLEDQPVEADSPLQLLFRIAPGLEQDPETKSCVTRCLELCEIGVELEQSIHVQSNPLAPSYQLLPPQDRKEAMRQGFDVAETERRRLGLGTARITDMADLISEQGIWATGAQLPDGIAGFCIKHPKVGISIIVNYSHPKGRKRFSYAHEYAHALMDGDSAVNVTDRDNATDLVETRANCFAAAFLAPEAGIWEVLSDIQKGQPSRVTFSVFSEVTKTATEAELRRSARSQAITYQDVAIVAHHFLVSYQSAAYRLRSIGAISAAELEPLLEKEPAGSKYLQLLGIDAVNKREDPSDRELNGMVLYLASTAYRGGEISSGRFAEIMETAGLSADNRREVLDLTAGLMVF